MTQNSGSAQFDAWAVVVAAAEAVGKFDTACPGRFSLDASGRLSELGRDDARAVLFWDPSHGWDSLLSPAHPQSDILELYLPISSATASRPITIGHLGQSLDGSIATRS